MKTIAILGLLLVLVPGRLEAGFIVNGSFENSLSDWTPSYGLVSAVSSYAGTNPTTNEPYSPKDQSMFARLEAGNQDTYTTLSQSFLASAGQTLSGYAFFKANDQILDDDMNPLPFNDDAYVKIIENGEILFWSSVFAVGNFGSTPWTSFSYTFTSGGSYTIQAGVRNVGDNEFASVLGLDDVQLSPDPVPEPASVLLWSLGALGIMFARRNRRSKISAASFPSV